MSNNTIDKIMEAVGCNICGAPLSEMEDNQFYKHVQCTRCKSSFRHRMFVNVYDSQIKPEFDMSQKRVLYIAPSNTETLMFEKLGVYDLIRVDARPLPECDMVVDICDMPQLEDSSFDAVYACSVFRYVYSDEAAIREIHRILRGGGRLFMHVVSSPGWKTQLDPNQTEEYGKESFEQHKVASFRHRYGDNELYYKLQQYFLVKTLYSVDGPCGKADKWFCGVKSAKWNGLAVQPHPYADVKGEYI